MSATEERLYDLLPAVLRTRDAGEGEPLRALLAVLQTEFDAVEGDIDDLYENWFIETCVDWIVPYIGDLLGTRGLHAVSPRTSTARAVVAHTLGYRRRKGTASMLEQLARDVTGWPARTVECFERLATTQHVNHVRPRSTTVELRGAGRLECLGGPFELEAHTVEVRRIASRGGRYDIPNVGVFMWRLRSYPLTGIGPRPVADPSDGRFTFDVLGADAPLFNVPRTEDTEVTQLAQEPDVPGPLRRRALYDELQAIAAGPEAPRRYFAEREPAFQIVADGAAKVPDALVVCDLTTWHRPPAGRVAVDPVLGRIAFPPGEAPAVLRADHSYGFGGDLGGGPYDRTESAAAALTAPAGWQIGVSQSEAPKAGVIVSTLVEAVRAWNAQPAGTRGVIAILDSGTYAESLTGADRIDVAEGSELLVVAADWPAAVRTPGSFAAIERRPHLRGDVELHGPAGAGAGSRVTVNGLLVEGSLTVPAGGLDSLALEHSTLAWGHAGLVAAAGSDDLTVRVDHAIVPRIVLGGPIARLAVADSIVGDGSGQAIDATATPLDVQRSTVLGETSAELLEAGNSIFAARVVATRRQAGCVRFSYVPRRPEEPALDSRTPRRYRCQPDLAVAGLPDPAAARARIRVVPQFTAATYGRPAFAQLSATCPPEIVTGAEDGSEMGAFSSLGGPLREANLLASLPEYLRFGLEAGIFHVT